MSVYDFDPEQFAIRTGTRTDDRVIGIITIMCMDCTDFMNDHDSAEFPARPIGGESNPWIDLKLLLD